jgi:hypothetical protein
MIWFNEMIMLGTAFVGSYLFVRGVSFYVGGFTNEYILLHRLANNIEQPEWRNPIMWGYLGAIISMTCVTVVG